MSYPIGIVTINHLRPRVLHLWLASIKRLRKDMGVYIPAIVVSGEEDKALCADYEVTHMTQPNKPVSLKWNEGFQYMRMPFMAVEYVMILGSDDIISTELYRNILEETGKGTDLIGVNALWFYAGDGAYRGKTVRLNGQRLLAPAKTISAKVLDNINWVICPTEKNWGMDAIMDQAIKPYWQTRVFVDGVVVDVKTKTNLNSWNIWGHRLPTVDSNLFYNILSVEEKKILDSL
jgi:hypothetical protein